MKGPAAYCQPPNNPFRTRLPAGWQEYKEPRTQRSYYHNEYTGVTQWQRPEILETPRTIRPPPIGQNRYSENSILIPDVGIHLVQDKISSKLVVSYLVPGGSADRFVLRSKNCSLFLTRRLDLRSGIIRIHDAVVKVDDEDIQGQPMHVISNLIAGPQGTFVVIAFRRMAGKDIFYYDVELERGSPDYFSSLDMSGQANFTDPSNIDSLRAWAADYKNLVRDIAW
jgi:hypothetical protein